MASSSSRVWPGACVRVKRASHLTHGSRLTHVSVYMARIRDRENGKKAAVSSTKNIVVRERLTHGRVCRPAYRSAEHSARLNMKCFSIIKFVGVDDVHSSAHDLSIYARAQLYASYRFSLAGSAECRFGTTYNAPSRVLIIQSRLSNAWPEL